MRKSNTADPLRNAQIIRILHYSLKYGIVYRTKLIRVHPFSIPTGDRQRQVIQYIILPTTTSTACSPSAWRSPSHQECLCWLGNLSLVTKAWEDRTASTSHREQRDEEGGQYMKEVQAIDAIGNGLMDVERRAW